MNGRDNRLKAIRKIIVDSRVSSQDQLLHKLEEEGVTITQATLSRDLKVLKMGKVPDAEMATANRQLELFQIEDLTDRPLRRV